MSKNIQATALADALANELTLYAKEVEEGVEAAGEKSIKKLVKLTRATAPVGPRGSFKRHITSTKKKSGRLIRYIWHVRAPDYRLTHLLVNGHATKDGGRTKGDPFLKNALDQVLPEYEREVKEAIEK